MSIREQQIFENETFNGRVDLGSDIYKDASDNVPLTKNALCFMVVTLNDGWKIPLRYCLIKNLNVCRTSCTNIESKCV